MCPGVASEKPADCPKCGMALESIALDPGTDTGAAMEMHEPMFVLRGIGWAVNVIQGMTNFMRQGVELFPNSLPGGNQSGQNPQHGGKPTTRW